MLLMTWGQTAIYVCAYVVYEGQRLQSTFCWRETVYDQRFLITRFLINNSLHEPEQLCKSSLIIKNTSPGRFTIVYSQNTRFYTVYTKRHKKSLLFYVYFCALLLPVFMQCQIKLVSSSHRGGITSALTHWFNWVPNSSATSGIRSSVSWWVSLRGKKHFCAPLKTCSKHQMVC